MSENTFNQLFGSDRRSRVSFNDNISVMDGQNVELGQHIEQMIQTNQVISGRPVNRRHEYYSTISEKSVTISVTNYEQTIRTQTIVTNSGHQYPNQRPPTINDPKFCYIRSQAIQMNDNLFPQNCGRNSNPFNIQNDYNNENIEPTNPRHRSPEQAFHQMRESTTSRHRSQEQAFHQIRESTTSRYRPPEQFSNWMDSNNHNREPTIPETSRPKRALQWMETNKENKSNESLFGDIFKDMAEDEKKKKSNLKKQKRSHLKVKTFDSGSTSLPRHSPDLGLFSNSSTAYSQNISLPLGSSTECQSTPGHSRGKPSYSGLSSNREQRVGHQLSFGSENSMNRIDNRFIPTTNSSKGAKTLKRRVAPSASHSSFNIESLTKQPKVDIPLPKNWVIGKSVSNIKTSGAQRPSRFDNIIETYCQRRAVIRSKNTDSNESDDNSIHFN